MKSQMGEYNVAMSDFHPKYWLLDYPGYIERVRVRDMNFSFEIFSSQFSIGLNFHLKSEEKIWFEKWIENLTFI